MFIFCWKVIKQCELFFKCNFWAQIVPHPHFLNFWRALKAFLPTFTTFHQLLQTFTAYYQLLYYFHLHLWPFTTFHQHLIPSANLYTTFTNFSTNFTNFHHFLLPFNTTSNNFFHFSLTFYYFPPIFMLLMFLLKMSVDNIYHHLSLFKINITIFFKVTSLAGLFLCQLIFKYHQIFHSMQHIITIYI